MRKALFLFPFLLILHGKKTYAQTWQEIAPVVCHGVPEDAFTSLRTEFNDPSKARLTATSTFIITYEDVPSQAQTAFQYATDIWSNLLISSIPIRIHVTYKSLASTTLASSGATRIYRDFNNAPYPSVWYPVALAEAINGKELNEEAIDINISINSAIRWSYQTDGRTTSGVYDFVTVVLHEIAHGLGFVSSFGVTDTNLQGKWGQADFPLIFDLFVQNLANQNLQDTRIFGNPSSDLLAQLTSTQLKFDLPGQRSPLIPRLFAPRTYAPGNSISHLDESIYPQGNTNSLMTPNIRSAEVIHQPGDLTKRILNQLGWPITDLQNGLITGISEIDKNQPIVYPNPVVGTDVIVFFPKEWVDKNVEISWITSDGKIQKHESRFLKEGKTQINIPEFSNGLYILRLTDGVQITQKRIYLNR